MDSPSSRPPAEFQWGTTLWHEMAHVFTLEATNHLVPRWFSEGVSVFEEWRSGPNPGVRIPMSVYNAMKEDLFLPIAELDEGFVRPTYDEQVIVSYMQAGLVCMYIDEAYGTRKLKDVLYAFKEGMLTGEAISEVLGISPSDFDDDFADFVDREHGSVLVNLEEWHRTQQSIGQRLLEEDWESIVGLAGHMIDILPQYIEPDSPYIAMAKAKEELGFHSDAIQALEQYWQNGGYDPAALTRLSGWLIDAGRARDAIEVLQVVNLVDPLDQELHGNLGDLLLAEQRPDEALLEYQVALALNPHDKATAHYRIATAHNALGDRQASQGQLLLALDVAPNFRPAQRLLLELMRADSGNEHN
jgi:tetratricopeptide (TPR) repeat protein